MEFSRRTFLEVAGAAPAQRRLAGAEGRRAPSDRLNLVVIVVDTWGAHWFGCYGNQEVRTPNVDALAARSAVFEEAFAEALPTLPARRALYTGRQIFPSWCSRGTIRSGSADGTVCTKRTSRFRKPCAQRAI